jgi:hypothetical protein
MGVMTLFEDDRYNWRETYFVYFESVHRPKLPEIRRALRTYAPFLSMLESKAEPDGRLVEMTIASYEDHAALEIVYREGNDVLTEIRHLAHSLEKDATPQELAQLQKVIQCNTRFDVHHFEQTAGTAVFRVMKLPTLKFAKQSTAFTDERDAFSKALNPDPVSGKSTFYFDPDSYTKCRSDGTGEEMDIADTNTADSGEYERINPDMLVTILEILCHLSKGVALDPASGIVL